MFADVLALDAVLEPAKGAIFAGKFRLVDLVARGGMGAVWRATDLALGREVAVKFMDATLAASAELRARFEREARAAAALASPYVVQIHDHGVDDGTPFIVMEMLYGEDLGTRLKRVQRLALADAAVLVGQISRGLRKAHEVGIVHRDLKPSNIFLARTDDDEEIAKILDFGVAKTGEAGESTQSGVLLGSVNYMSPEQARGIRIVDGRSDLWALAAITFRTVTGQMVFPGQATGDVIIRICSHPIPRATAIAPDLPPEIDAFFDRAMAKDPADRFQTARELADALASVAGVAPPSRSVTIYPRQPIPSASDLPRQPVPSTSEVESASSRATTENDHDNVATQRNFTPRTDPRLARPPLYSRPPPPRPFGLKSVIAAGAVLGVISALTLWSVWAMRSPTPAVSAQSTAPPPIASAPSLATTEPAPPEPTAEPTPSAPGLATTEPEPAEPTAEPTSSAASLATTEPAPADGPVASASASVAAPASAKVPSPRGPGPRAPRPNGPTEKRVPLY